MSKSSSRPQSDTESVHGYVAAGMNCEHCVVAAIDEAGYDAVAA